MKKFRIDGLSRGDFLEGDMTRKYPLNMISMDIGELDRAGRIEKWIGY